MNTPPVCESFSHVQADQNHLQEWLNTPPGCESLSHVWAVQNHWQEWLNTPSACESLSHVWAVQNHWQEWLNTPPACESLSHFWADQNHWQEWLTGMFYSDCNLFSWFSVYHYWLIFFKARDLAVFLNPYFKTNTFSMTSFKFFKSKPKLPNLKSSFIIFTGLLSASLLVWQFTYFITILPTALLICLENTFWKISGHGDHDGNFVELFKESFTLYVGSGLRKKTEADIDVWRSQLEGEGGPLAQGRRSRVTKEFEAKFCEIIKEHYLRTFHCFYLHSTHLSYFV